MQIAKQAELNACEYVYNGLVINLGLKCSMKNEGWLNLNKHHI